MRGKLTALFCGRVTKPGRYADGNNLYLVVAPRGSKHWAYRYDRPRDTWLGLNAPYPTVGLVVGARRYPRHGANPAPARSKDPLGEKRATKAAARSAKTFRAVALDFIAGQRAGWSKT